MINRLIEWSLKNRGIVIAFYVALAAAGYWALTRTPIDAIPDLSDNQVIVFTDWAGRSPQEVEDQVTYPLVTNLQGLKNGEQEIFLSFTDASGKAVDVGMVNAAALNFQMPAMGSMAQMNDAATFTTTSVPGVYKGKVKIEMPGEWQAQISYEGSAGNGKTSIPVTAY